MGTARGRVSWHRYGEGIDVDIVADVHKLSQTTGEEQFDIVISCSSFEHFKYPHLAAHEIMKALKTGGLFLSKRTRPIPSTARRMITSGFRAKP